MEILSLHNFNKTRKLLIKGGVQTRANKVDIRALRIYDRDAAKLLAEQKDIDMQRKIRNKKIKDDAKVSIQKELVKKKAIDKESKQLVEANQKVLAEATITTRKSSATCKKDS